MQPDVKNVKFWHNPPQNDAKCDAGDASKIDPRARTKVYDKAKS